MKAIKHCVIMFSALPLLAGAEPITFTGVVDAELPKIELQPAGTLVSDVKEFNLKPVTNAGICRLTASEEYAKNHGAGYFCLIKWSEIPGVTQDAIGIKGIAAGAGEKKYQYDLALFDGGEFKPFFSDEIAATFVAPVAPSQPSIYTDWAIRADDANTDHKLFNRKEVLSRVTLKATSRNYDQVASFHGKTCTIPEGKTECDILVSKGFTSTETDQGTDELPFFVTDKYDFFAKSEQKYALSWDFRPPEVVKYFVNADSNRLPMIITDYGDPFVLYPDQAAVVVKSPHSEEPGDWWYPTDPSLKLKVSENFKMTKTLTYEESPVTFNLALRNPLNLFTAKTITKPKLSNGYLIYTYDFKAVEDGMYDFTVATQDGNSNQTEQVYKEILVDRLPPDLQFVINNKQNISKSVNLYALSDLTAMAWGGWKDGTEIYEAKINGQPVDFVGGLPHIRRIADNSLVVKSNNVLTVKARDSVGNEVEKTLKFSFANFDFTHAAADALQKIEPAQIQLTQTEGLRCAFASSPELAAILSISKTRRGCTIDWKALPAGMTPVLPSTKSIGAITVAQGVVASEGTFPYQFDLYTHDYFGDSLTVYEGQGNVNILPITSPELTVGVPHIAENFGESYVYSKQYGKQNNVPYFIKKASRGRVTVELRNEAGDVLYTAEHANPSTELVARASFPATGEQPLSLAKYTVRAYYTESPQNYSEKTVNYYNTPESVVRLYSTHERTILENSQFQVFANIAMPDNGQLRYSPEMGEWDIYIAKYVDKDLVAITPKLRSDSNGRVEFVMDAKDIQDDVELQVVADFVSPYPEVKSRRISTSLMAVNVLRLSGITAQLTTPEVTLPLPARFALKTEFLEKIDKVSSGTVRWEVSEDGANWLPASSSSNSHLYTHVITEQKSQFVRASLEHVITKDISYTNVIKLTAYNKPELVLSGNTRVVAGALADFEHALSAYTQSKAAGPVEWSLDDQVSWTPMSPSERVSIDKDKIITARVLVHHEDESQPDYYVYDTLNVATIDPIMLKPIVNRSAQGLEVGEKIDFTARLSKQPYYPEESIRYEYQLPSGETKQVMQYSHVLDASDFVNKTANFSFRAWVDGLKEQTITTVNLPVRQIIYAFPSSWLQLSNSTRVVNSTFIASVEAKLANLPSTVKTEVQWYLPPGVQLVRAYPGNRRVLLNATNVGIHNIKATFSDNRGNTIEHEKLMEAINPPPLSLELVATPSNEFNRPPINYFVRSKIKLGHPDDKVTKYQWSLDDQPVSGSSTYINNYEFDKPGTHKLSMTVETDMGQKHTETLNIVVNPNKPPKCQPFTELRSTTWVLNANCSDQDGKITQIEYTFDENGTPRVFKTFSQTILFSASKYPSLSIDIKAFDDSGEFIETSAQY